MQKDKVHPALTDPDVAISVDGFYYRLMWNGKEWEIFVIKNLAIVWNGARFEDGLTEIHRLEKEAVSARTLITALDRE